MPNGERGFNPFRGTIFGTFLRRARTGAGTAGRRSKRRGASPGFNPFRGGIFRTAGARRAGRARKAR